MSQDTPTVPDPFDVDFEAELAALDSPDEQVDVVMFVPNGVVDADGNVAFVPVQYTTTLSALMAAQAVLENGVVLDAAAARARAVTCITGVTKDAAVADDIATGLLEAGLLTLGAS
jgi:hypothetical protein